MELKDELQIGKYEISLLDKYEKDTFLLKYKTWELFSKGNISSIIGKAKTKKTFLCTLFAGAIISGSLYNCFSSGRHKVLYIDTEQSPYYVHWVLKRISSLAGKDNLIKVFHLRPLNPIERVKMVEAILETYKYYDMVFIDGTRDLIYDINSQEQSTEIVSKLMKWSEIYDMHITNVVHENKNDNYARGHIGTEIMNKSETVIRVGKSPDLKEVSLVRCEYSRNIPFDTFAFSINDDGLPIMEDVDEIAEGLKTSLDEIPF